MRDLRGYATSSSSKQALLAVASCHFIRMNSQSRAESVECIVIKNDMLKKNLHDLFAGRVLFFTIKVCISYILWCIGE
jgi:hypothetical protein